MHDKKSRTQNTLINTVMGVVSRLSNTVLAFVLRTVFIYTLGIQYTGVSGVFSDILTMLSLTELGIGAAISTALYRPLRENDQSQIRKLMRFYKTAYRLIAAAIMVIGVALLPFLDYLIKDVPDIQEDIRVIFILYIMKTATSYLMIYKSTLLIADQKEYSVKRTEILCLVVRYASEILCLVVFRQYMAYLVIEVVATVLQNYVVTRKAEKEYPYAFRPAKDERLSKAQITSLLKDIKGLAVYKFSGPINNSLAGVLVSGFINTTAAGMLSNYTLIRYQIETLLRQFYNAVTPSIGNLAAERDNDKQLAVFNRLFYLSFIVVNFCSVSYFVIVQPFISLWIGEQYLLELPVAFLVAFDSFLYILLQAAYSFRTANGMFVQGQYRPLVTIILNILLAFLLIGKLGIGGTLLASVIARLTTQWYDSYLLYKHIFRKPFGRFNLMYWGYIAIFISGCALTYFAASLVQTESLLLTLAFRAVCCVTIPNVWAVLFTFRSEGFGYAVSVFQGVVKKLSRRAR